MFKPEDTKKSLTLTLIHHEGYALEKDFYLLLKNPMGKVELGEPNLARITIIDDDGNDLLVHVVLIKVKILKSCRETSKVGILTHIGKWVSANFQPCSSCHPIQQSFPSATFDQ